MLELYKKIFPMHLTEYRFYGVLFQFLSACTEYMSMCLCMHVYTQGHPLRRQRMHGSSVPVYFMKSA